MQNWMPAFTFPTLRLRGGITSKKGAAGDLHPSGTFFCVMRVLSAAPVSEWRATVIRSPMTYF